MGILVIIELAWIKGVKARCQHYGTDVEGFGGFLLIEIHCAGGAEFLAGAAFAFLHINTGITVDTVFQGYCLGIFDKSGFALDEPYIILVLDLFGAFLRTQTAGNAQGFINVSRFFEQLDLKVTRTAFYFTDLTEGSQLNV